MFFDNPVSEKKTDRSEWRELLRKVAREPRALISHLYDPAEGLKAWFWDTAEYRQARERLMDARAAARNYARQHHFPIGTYWWNVDWDMVETFLVRDLLLEPDSSSQIFKRKLIVKQENGWYHIFLSEHVHFQNFSGSRSVSYGIASKYSVDEINSHMHDYNRNLTVLSLAFYGNPQDVRHSDFDQRYYAGAAWMGSTDYLLQRMALDKMERDSMYAERTTNHLSVSGHSSNRDSIYLAGSYQILNGEMVTFRLFPYQLMKREGAGYSDHPEIGTQYSPCLAAWQIAEGAEVSRIPLELIDEDLVIPASSFENAAFQSQIMTCFAGKLI